MALKEGYVEVSERVSKFRNDHAKGSIETEVTTQMFDLGEERIILNTVKATIKDSEGKILGTAHAQGEAGDEKNLEKTETVAVGRALVNAGYKAVEDVSAGEMEEEVEAAKKETKSRFSKESKSSSRFQKPSKAAKAEETKEEESEEEESEEETSEAEEKAEAAPAKETTKAGTSSSKVSDLLAKYGKKSNGSGLSNMRR